MGGGGGGGNEAAGGGKIQLCITASVFIVQSFPFLNSSHAIPLPGPLLCGNETDKKMTNVFKKGGREGERKEKEWAIAIVRSKCMEGIFSHAFCKFKAHRPFVVLA